MISSMNSPAYYGGELKCISQREHEHVENEALQKVKLLWESIIMRMKWVMEYDIRKTELRLTHPFCMPTRVGA